MTSSFNTLSRSQLNVSNYLIYWMRANSVYAYTRCVVHLKSNWLLDWTFLSYLLWHTKQILFDFGFLVRIRFISNTLNIHTENVNHENVTFTLGARYWNEWWVSSFPIGKLECWKLGRLLYITWVLFCFVYVYICSAHMIRMGNAMMVINWMHS